MELCSVMCQTGWEQSLVEALYYLPEMITTLLIGYLPKQDKKFICILKRLFLVFTSWVILNELPKLSASMSNTKLRGLEDVNDRIQPKPLEQGLLGHRE